MTEDTEGKKKTKNKDRSRGILKVNLSEKKEKKVRCREHTLKF